MITLRQILITAWIILLLFVAMRRIDIGSASVQQPQLGNQVQVMEMVDKP